MDWVENYSKKEYYWQRRNIATKLYEIAKSKVKNLEKLEKQLTDLNQKLHLRHKKLKFKCVYSFREGQNIDTESQEGGGFSDIWQRCNYFSLPFASDEEDSDEEIPLPDNPITVYLRPSDSYYKPILEFTECMHPKCFSKNDSIMQQKQVIFLLCNAHSEKEVVEAIENFAFNGKNIENIVVKDFVEKFLNFMTERISQTLDIAISNAVLSLAEDIKPDKVIEVECYAYPGNEGEMEEIKVYVDLESYEIIN